MGCLFLPRSYPEGLAQRQTFNNSSPLLNSFLFFFFPPSMGSNPTSRVKVLCSAPSWKLNGGSRKGRNGMPRGHTMIKKYIYIYIFFTKSMEPVVKLMAH